MALTGFNPEIVYQSVNGVRNAYDGLIAQLGNRVQTEFVNEMGRVWACREAQDFFNMRFKGIVDDIISRVNTTFGSVVDTMNFAAQKWAMTTGSQYNSVPFSPNMVSIDTSVILENINGVRGIDIGPASSVLDKLQVISSSITEYLDSAIKAVSTSGFVGGSQEEQLISSLSGIKTSCEQSFLEVLELAKVEINATADKYSTVEGQISQAFIASNQ